jgi:hypothetical protein
MKPCCIGKSNTNNLPAPIDLAEGPQRKQKLCFKDATQKSFRVVLLVGGIEIELVLVPRDPIS